MGSARATRDSQPGSWCSDVARRHGSHTRAVQCSCWSAGRCADATNGCERRSTCGHGAIGDAGATRYPRRSGRRSDAVRRHGSHSKVAQCCSRGTGRRVDADKSWERRSTCDHSTILGAQARRDTPAAMVGATRWCGGTARIPRQTLSVQQPECSSMPGRARQMAAVKHGRRRASRRHTRDAASV